MSREQMIDTVEEILGEPNAFPDLFIVDRSGPARRKDAARAVVDAVESEYVTRDWHGLMAILDSVYPETTFPTMKDREDRDSGPRIISLIRLLDQAREQ